MTKVNQLRCDVCEDEIETRFAFLKRSRFWSTLLYVKRWWGGYEPGDEGWVQQRIDICDQCWREVLEEVQQKVNQ